MAKGSDLERVCDCRCSVHIRSTYRQQLLAKVLHAGRWVLRRAAARLLAVTYTQVCADLASPHLGIKVQVRGGIRAA